MELFCSAYIMTSKSKLYSHIMEFLNASGKDDIIRKYENLIKAPAYYNPVFTNAEMRIVEEETGDIYSKLGC